MDFKNKKLIRVVQILFGLYLAFFGVIGYLITLPAPEYSEAGMAFLGALFSSGYMFHVMSVIFVLSGLMFLLNKFSAFGAILLVPITFNILLFHLFLDMKGIFIALIPIILNIYLIYVNLPKYKPMFLK